MKFSKELVVPLSILMMTCSLIAAAVYFVCHLYLNKISHESLQNWIQAETVNIKEGNLLSAITKNQRVLSSSEFIKGVSLIDLSSNDQRVLIGFGEKILSRDIANAVKDEISTVDIGFLKQLVVARIPNNTTLAIGFQIDGYFLRVIFAITSFGLMILFALFSGTIFYLQHRESQKREQLIISESKGKLLFAEMAARVAHDIRSPMGVLTRITEQQLQSREAQEIITQVASRLQNITDDLVKYWQKEIKGAKDFDSNIAESTFDPIRIESILSELLSEKKNLYEHLENIEFSFVNASSSTLFAVDGKELARHLSNIIDNAVDAVGFSGKIVIGTNSDDKLIKIYVKDSGCGIPDDVLPLIGKEKLSIGKSSGSGYGLYYAREFINSLGGELTVESQIGQGSTITFIFPKNDRVLIFPKSDCIAYLDDDPLTYEPVRQFVKKMALAPIEVKVFETSSQYLDWSLENRNHILLCDYNLKEKHADGLSVIAGAKTKSAITSHLITNSYDDPLVVQRSKESSVPIIAKDKIFEYDVVWV